MLGIGIGRLGNAGVAGGNAAVITAIGGIEPETAGEVGTIYEGYTLSGGDDFNASVSSLLVSPASPRNKYGTTRGSYLIAGTATQAPRGSSGLAGYDWDPTHTGDQDLNRGRSVASLQDIIIKDGSLLVLKSRQASPAEQALFKDTAKPLVASMIHFAGALMLRAPGIIECRMRMPAGAANPSGSHITFWTMMANPVSQALTEIELDWEASNAGSQMAPNYVTWNAGGNTGNTGTAVNNTTGFVTYKFVITDTEVKWYIDNTLHRTATIAIGTYDRPIYALITNHAYQAEYGAGVDWTAAGAGGCTLEVDWVRYWRASTAAHYTPLVSQADINVDYGAAFSTVLPTAATVWGDGTVTEVVEAYMTDANEPGGSYNGGYANFPSGWSYTAGTRTLAGTAASTVTPGRVQILRHCWKSGSTCEPQRFMVNVGPNIVTNDIVLANGANTTYDLYADVQMGTLVNVDAANPKAIVVTGLPAGCSFNATTGLLELAPSANDTISYLTISCTNIAGQTASREVSLIVGTPAFSTEAQTFFTACANQPTTTQKAQYDRVIRAWVANGIWAKLIKCTFDAGHHAADVLINPKTPGTLNATLVSTPSHTVGQGYLGNGSSTAINDNFTPDSSHQNALGLVVASVTAGGGGSADIGNTNSVIAIRGSAGDALSSRVNSGTSGTSTNTDGKGIYIHLRTGSAAGDSVLYKNGAVIARTGEGVSATPSGQMRHCGRGGSSITWGTKRIAFAGYFGGTAGLSQADEPLIRVPLNRWLRDVGAAIS